MGFVAGVQAAEKGDNLQFKDKQNQQENIDQLQLSILIPLAAIIRDFWVVEERVKVFGVARTTRKPPSPMRCKRPKAKLL